MAELLDLASDQFSDNSCNDFILENTKENLELAKKIENDGDLFIDDEGINISDFIVMKYFADVCKENSK